MRSILLRPAAETVAWRVAHQAGRAADSQKQTLRELLRSGRETSFGREHGLAAVANARRFRDAVPVRDYEAFSCYIERIRAGESDVLWPGRPAYFALTSGTTSGTKFLPVTNASLPTHYRTTRRAVFNYYGRTGRGSWFDGKSLVLSSSPSLSEIDGVPEGYISGIVANHVPRWFRGLTLPSDRVARIGDWDRKIEAIVDETVGRDIRLVAGIPSWMQMYFEALLERTGKREVRQVFPNLCLYVHGGVDYSLYRAVIDRQIGASIETLEVYPATEAFLAFQDGQAEGMLLNLDAGIFFEFIPLAQYGQDAPERFSLCDAGGLAVGVDYVLVISASNGLWGYALGDTVRFVSISPPRIVFTGRTQSFISIVAERLIAKEVEQAAFAACGRSGSRAAHFTVAPQTDPPDGGRSFHEWFVEFDGAVPDLKLFAQAIDESLSSQNYNYGYFRNAALLGPPRVVPLRPGAVRDHMRSQGRIGGQFKLPRLQNNRVIAAELERMRLS